MWTCYRNSPWCLLVASALLTGCITFIRPDPAWNEPLDLNLHEASMADAVVTVTCGVKQLDAPIVPVEHEFCQVLAADISHMGARVIRPTAEDDDKTSPPDPPMGADAHESPAEEATGEGEEDEKKDRSSAEVRFQVLYVDHEQPVSYCGWSTPLFIMSFTFFPLVCDIQGHGELRFLNESGQLQKTIDLRLTARKYMGIGALYFFAVRGVRKWTNPEDSLDRNMRGRRLGTFLQNSVYTFYESRRRLGVTASTATGSVDGSSRDEEAGL